MGKMMAAVLYGVVALIWGIKGALWAADSLGCSGGATIAFVIFTIILILGIVAYGTTGFGELIASLITVASFPLIIYLFEWFISLIILFVNLFFKIFGWANMGEGIMLILIIIVILWILSKCTWIFFF